MCIRDSNSRGQLGNSGGNSNMPVPVSELDGSSLDTAVSLLSGGNAHTCALLEDGTVWCWGNNESGQLGSGDNTNTNTPVKIN